MSSDLDVRPSQSRPNGGYATVVPTGGKAFDGSQVFLTVYDGFRERYLTEGGQWHGAADKFGPYPVETDGSITVGPEIVNHMEEYALITLSGGGLVGDISWPDGVFAAPGAPAIGQVHAEGDDVSASQLTGQTKSDPAPDPTPTPPLADPGPAPEKDAGETHQDPVPEEKSGSKLWIWLVLLALIAAAVGAYFYLQDPGEVPVVENDEPAAPAEPCGLAALRSVEGGYSALAQAISDCGDGANQETSFLAVETLAKQNDPDALLAFGHLYNADVSDPFLETELGVSLTPNPSVAVDYYKQSVQAGNADAEPFLTTLCDAMRTSGDMLQESAAQLHCDANSF